ncbi:TetR/AcrR family transcriptional regulator C-terminal domain-containing protein [Amycolatopsis kentuckyensis]|uniref:TetR/AcrR family transcriptional regulator C-terminal domain-containing protein n=1 Tax=Amycolatopsis kentuckyensis TaxID=218823 RepID=UPI001FC9CA50|nr:TetR/AcrR family transcriptional regulator C-terminal domain-containing protein [Amycolatopsis kentuckyensis]
MQDTAATGGRERLNRAKVLGAAVELADEGGFEALTMRRLAAQLGVVPMALYKHVADKRELLDGMVDLVFAEVEVPVDVDWRTAMHRRAASMRQTLLRHPWAVGRMETGTPGPANLHHHNAVMRCLRRDAGFPFRMAVHAYNLMDAYVYGFALQEKTLAGDIPAEAARRQKAVVDRKPSELEDYPYLAEVVTELAKTGFAFADEFEFGLDLILEGLSRMPQQASRAAGSGSNSPLRSSAR